jgi:D-alanine-D-alanine ligase-like ATP-grasp enzyme
MSQHYPAGLTAPAVRMLVIHAWADKTGTKFEHEVLPVVALEARRVERATIDHTDVFPVVVKDGCTVSLASVERPERHIYRTVVAPWDPREDDAMLDQIVNGLKCICGVQARQPEFFQTPAAEGTA